MSDIIIPLLGISVWTIIFIASFFFGLFFLLFVVFTSFGHHTADKTLHSHGPSHDMVDHHDFGVSSDHSIDSSHAGDLHTDSLALDHDVDDLSHLDGHIEIDQSGDISIVKDSIYIEKSNYTLGNIAVFLLIFGQVGWLVDDDLTDIWLAIAVAAGIVISRLFAYILSNYAGTTIIPVQHVTRGDIGTAITDISQSKLGIVQVVRKDGMVTTILARGAFPHDSFMRGDRGYILDEEDEFFTITRGLEDQPDLNTKFSKVKKKKALD